METRGFSGQAFQSGSSGKVAFIDMERAYDHLWGARLGIDPKRLHLYQPDSGEMAQNLIAALLKAKAYDLIVLDSIAETAFDAELEAKAEDNHVGLAARKWAIFCRKVKPMLAVSGTALVFINQVRMKIGVMYGNPETVYGGKAIGFAASIRVKMLSPYREPTALVLRPTAEKNKTAPPKREAEVRLLTSVARPFVDVAPELVSLGRELAVFTNKDGVIKFKKDGDKSIVGHWYFNGEPVGSSEAAVIESLRNNPDFLETVQIAVEDAIAALNLSGDAAAPVREEEVDDVIDVPLIRPER